MSKGGRHSGGPASAAGAAVRVQREGEGHVHQQEASRLRTPTRPVHQRVATQANASGETAAKEEEKTTSDGRTIGGTTTRRTVGREAAPMESLAQTQWTLGRQCKQGRQSAVVFTLRSLIEG